MKHDSVNSLVVSMYADQIEHIKTTLAKYEPVVTKTSGSSVYISFRALPKDMKHKMRVSDHPDTKEYTMKWHLCVGYMPDREQQKPFTRYYNSVVGLTNAFQAYYEAVENSKD